MVWSAENLVPIGVVTWLGSGYAATDQRQWLRHAVAAADAGHGGGADRPCLDVARRVVVPCTTLAAASRGVSPQARWEAARGGDLSR